LYEKAIYECSALGRRDIPEEKEGETNRVIGESLGLMREQIEHLVCRENRRKRRIAAGYKPHHRGRPKKDNSDRNGDKGQ